MASVLYPVNGSICALATPFGADGAVDFDAWARLLRRQLDGGTQAMVVAGSTGEAAALDEEEFRRLLRTAADVLGGRLLVLAGTGLSNTAKTIRQTRLAREAGAEAALVVTPPYVRATQAGLIAHYRAVADEGGLPIVLYNVPGRTGCDLLPETAAALAPHSGIVGIKEARTEPERMAALLPLKSPAFVVLSGDDPTACRAMLNGADGVISVASNIVPRAFRRLADAARAGEDGSARSLDARLAPLYRFLSVESNPIPLKALLTKVGIGQGLRLPLQRLSAQHAAETEAMSALAATLESESRGVRAA